jgi:hypothetical protein
MSWQRERRWRRFCGRIRKDTNPTPCPFTQSWIHEWIGSSLFKRGGPASIYWCRGIPSQAARPAFLATERLPSGREHYRRECAFSLRPVDPKTPTRGFRTALDEAGRPTAEVAIPSDATGRDERSKTCFECRRNEVRRRWSDNRQSPVVGCWDAGAILQCVSHSMRMHQPYNHSADPITTCRLKAVRGNADKAF